MKHLPTRILLLGFDPRVIKAFEIFFSSKCSGQFHIQQDPKSSEIALIDFDIVHSRKDLMRLIEANAKLIIFSFSMLEQSLDIPNVFLLKKPVDYLSLKKELMSVRNTIIKGKQFKNNRKIALKPTSSMATTNKTPVNEPTFLKRNNSDISHSTSAANALSRKEESHFVGNQLDVDLQNPQELLKIFYSNENRFQKILLETINSAKTKKLPIQLECLGIILIIDPIAENIVSSVGDRKLRPICLLDIAQPGSIEYLNNPIHLVSIAERLNKPQDQLIITSFEAFIWKVTLWTARGKIPKMTDLKTPAYLSEWPNFTRLQNFPHSMQIAAFLIQQPCTLEEVASNLQISQRYVFSFFSAAQSIGISNISTRKIDTLLTSNIKQKNLAPRSFLNKLIGRLVSSPKKELGLTHEL